MEEEILEFPVAGADSCPNCGSKERVLERAITRLKEEGKLSEKAFSRGCAIQFPLFEPARVMAIAPTIKIPVLLVYYDVCAQCKTIYSTGVELIEQPATVQVMGSQPKPDFRCGQFRPSK